VVFWKMEEKVLDQDAKGEEKPKRFFIAKGYTVFNAAQVEGFTPPKNPGLSPAERNARAEDFLHGLGADIRHGSTQPAYDPKNDFIMMPDYERFKSGAAYYSTLSHEVTHNAESRIMPRRSQFSLQKPGSTSALRHNQSDSRKASSASSGR